jgi:hypothetical protein
VEFLFHLTARIASAIAYNERCCSRDWDTSPM